MNKQTILAIDDSGIVLRSLKEWLKDYYEVIVAGSAKTGMRYLESHTADLILLDILMPEMDGFEAYESIRQMENGQDVPIVFLTGLDDAEKEIKGLELGAADFVRKPIQPQILINRIQRILSLEEYNKHIEAVIERQRHQLESLTLEAITTIAATIDAKDSYTKGHSDRVAEYSVRIGKKLGLSESELTDIQTMGLLHDIGKIGIPDQILCKSSRLEDEEFAIMKTHTSIGANILASIQSIPGIANGAKYHHERYDGKGYPEGKHGTDIPLEGRIIAVADAYDAMTSNRVYRKHLSMETVISELERGKGSQFDPQLADIMLEIIREEKNV